MNTIPQLPESVWGDLAALYLAGEASTETRHLIDARAGQDPRFAQTLSGARGLSRLEVADVPVPVDHALQALRRTREYLLLRTIFLAMAIAFTLLPFTILVQHGEITFFLWRDLPGAARGFLGVALASWSAWYVMHRQVRKAFRRSSQAA